MESSRTFKIETSTVKANILPEFFFFFFFFLFPVQKRLEVTNFCYIVETIKYCSREWNHNAKSKI